MKRWGFGPVVLTIALLVSAGCAQAGGGKMTAPPGGEYKKVSSLVALPDFIPGLGTLYVVPTTLPAGPFLAYDRQGNLVSSVYMIPMKDITAHKAFNKLAAAKAQVDHVDLYFNAGHPGNASHSLRIPEAAAPWDSGFLVNPGDTFEVTLTIEGVYDYFCLPHEAAGMVGRIVVGRPGGPGSLPFDYFAGRPGTQAWLPVPEAARATFPSVAAIVGRGVVRRR